MRIIVLECYRKRKKKNSTGKSKGSAKFLDEKK